MDHCSITLHYKQRTGVCSRKYRNGREHHTGSSGRRFHKRKKDEEPAAECVSEDVQAEISNENELSGEITTETENVPENGTQEQHDWEAKLYLDGTAEITKYTGSDKDVVIPSTIEGHTVTSLEQEVFYKNTTVETIHIPATVIHMGHRRCSDNYI